MAAYSKETWAIIHRAIAAEYTIRMGKKMNATIEKTEKTSLKSDAPTSVSSQNAITLYVASVPSVASTDSACTARVVLSRHTSKALPRHKATPSARSIRTHGNVSGSDEKMAAS